MTTAARPDTGTEYTQARIRLNEAGAGLLWQLLLAEEVRLTAAKKRAEDDYAYTRLQGELRDVRRVKAELTRAIAERGWAV